MTRNVSGITPTTSISQITRNDLSQSEQAAQGKIYDMYHHNSQNEQQEPCGCGTAAEIAYMGHKSTCEQFQWIHERSFL